MYKKFNGIIYLILIVISSMVFMITGLIGQEKKKTSNNPIERGQYLVEVGGCNDCHSPKKFTGKGPFPDETRLLSGHPENSKLPEINADLIGPGKWFLFNEHLTAAVGPWGVSFAANLTPDDQTGIGLWQEEHFIKAMRTGNHMGAGRPILPPMPWFNLAKATDDDLKAIFSYLKSIKPIKNSVPAPIPLSDLNK